MRHLREKYHRYGENVFWPDYRVIANDCIGSFYRIWDTGTDTSSGTPLFGTEMVEFVPKIRRPVGCHRNDKLSSDPAIKESTNDTIAWFLSLIEERW